MYLLDCCVAGFIQVNTKTDQILALLRSLKGDMKTYALLQLSQGFTDLSEGVSCLHKLLELSSIVHMCR